MSERNKEEIDNIVDLICNKLVYRELIDHKQSMVTIQEPYHENVTKRLIEVLEEDHLQCFSIMSEGKDQIKIYVNTMPYEKRNYSDAFCEQSLTGFRSPLWGVHFENKIKDSIESWIKTVVMICPPGMLGCELALVWCGIVDFVKPDKATRAAILLHLLKTLRDCETLYRLKVRDELKWLFEYEFQPGHWTMTPVSYLALDKWLDTL